MGLFKKKKYKFDFDPENPKFIVFSDYLSDKQFEKRARMNHGCAIKSKDNIFSVIVCTGDGFESFICCCDALKKIFENIIADYKRNSKNLDLNLLVNQTYWNIQIFKKAW